MATKEIKQELRTERSKVPKKNRMIKSEMITRRIGPDNPSHPDYMKGVYKTAQSGLDRVNRELAASKKTKKKHQAKKKLNTGKLKTRGAYSRKHGERTMKDSMKDGY